MAAVEGAGKATERLNAACGWGRCAELLSSEDSVARQRQGRCVAFDIGKQVFQHAMCVACRHYVRLHSKTLVGVTHGACMYKILTSMLQYSFLTMLY